MDTLLINKIFVIILLALFLKSAIDMPLGEHTKKINAYKQFFKSVFSLTIIYLTGFFNGLFTGGHFASQIFILVASFIAVYLGIKNHGKDEKTNYTPGKITFAYIVSFIIYWAGGLFEVFYK